MKEYISIDYLYSILTPRLLDSRGAEHYAYDCIKQEIDYAPKSEIVHFAQAKWEYPSWAPHGGSYIMRRCTNCDYSPDCDDSSPYTKYCPECGAMMREENGNGDA